MKAQKIFPLVVVVAGLLAYLNSFTGPFVFDDVGSIPENPTIRHLWPIWQCLSPPHRGGLTVEGRPLINLSLAINYALGGYNVWGYHALNLTVHILAGLALLGLVRRTLLQPALRERFGATANELALATAVLWTVHPLQTESVTYMIQRAESIMGLFYLLTLYCFIRGVESARPRPWYGLCVAACALGMTSKEVMVTAPVMVLLYDRAFVASSFREAWQRRWPLYLALSATWILLAVVLAAGHNFANASLNARSIHLTWWEYLATQPGVILYYLRLSVWPAPLSVSHPWSIARTWMGILPPAVVVVVLLGASARAVTRNPAPLRAGPAWGFVGAWFFLILAPTSSVVPLLDLVYEHRMYLSLAAVVSVAVMGLYSLMGRHSLAVFVALAVGLGVLTWRRNQDYRSEVTFWGDLVAKSPNNSAGYCNLGIALERAGRVQEAIAQFEQSLRLKRDSAEAHNDLGLVLWRRGKVEEAIEHYDRALKIKPDFAEAHYNLGLALAQIGKASEAIGHYEQAIRIWPGFAEAHYSLALALAQLGKTHEAIGHYQQALRLKPDYPEAHNNLGNILLQEGRMTEAIVQFEQALHFKPDFAEAHANLGNALLRTGRALEAIQHYEQALRLTPNSFGMHYNLGVALEEVGRVPEAIEQYKQALHLKPGFAQAQNRLARLRAAQ